MDGLFVDNQSCLCIVSETFDDPPRWNVHCAADANYDGFNAIIESQPSSLKWLQFKSDKYNTQGVFDGHDCIVWEDGNKWRRLKISFDQIHFLRKRPYVPITFVVVYVLKSWFMNVYARLT